MTTVFAPLKFLGKIFHNKGLQNFVISKMKLDLEVVSRCNNIAEGDLNFIKTELASIKRQLIVKKKAELMQENKTLQKEVEEKIKQLIALETQNGKVQVGLPDQVPVEPKAVKLTAEAPKEPPILASTAEVEKTSKQKEKKVKKEKATVSSDGGKSAPIPEAPIDVGRLDFRIGKIVEVSKHPDADSLYLEKIDCGESKPRTVVSGLVKFVPIEEMQDRMVVLLCNLKPAKMRGITSEAMVMCASTPEKVEVLSPPQGAVPGDVVCCDGYKRKPDAQLNPKKKIFETCAPDLKTSNELVACYKDSPLYVPGKGNIVAKTLKNVPIK